MTDVALVTWILAVLVGAYMAGVLLRPGDAGGAPQPSHLPSWMVFGHGSLAVAGLALWVVYMSQGGDVIPWVSFGLLLVVAGGGEVMFTRWLKVRRRAAVGAGGARGGAQTPGVPTSTIDRQVPDLAVLVHGVLAGATIVLVLLVALGVGDRT